MTRISQPPPAEARGHGAAETDAPAAPEATAPAATALAVSAADMDAIGRHAVRTYPEECCGFLLGEERGGTTRVDRVMEIAREIRAHMREPVSSDTSWMYDDETGLPK